MILPGRQMYINESLIQSRYRAVFDGEVTDVGEDQDIFHVEGGT